MGAKQTFLGRLLASSDKFSDEQVAQTINLLIEHGVKHGASDIHIEPHEQFVQVRYRIDNILRSTHKLPLPALPKVVEQLRELANLRTDQTHLPAEGAYSILVGEEQFEIQVSIMPVIGGEKIVLHLSRRLAQPPALEALGFWGDSLKKLQKALSYTHGLLLVGVPRRNGKSTTMHSMLQLLTVPTVSVATVEDKIDYTLSGVNQTKVRPAYGITFYAGLQAVLTQDPNVIMISSIPDKQTVASTIEAAVGGHFMLAGVTADNAVTAITHVQAAHEEAFLLGASLRASVSQRLVRKLCVHCREQYTPAREEISELEKAFGIATTTARQSVHQLEKHAEQDGLGGSGAMGTSTRGIVALWRASEEGCEQCNHTGYQGSIGVVEVLDATDEVVQHAIVARATASKLRSIALKAGFIPMELDGLVKALRGQTTIAEILRVLSI